ncbi:MAG: ABC transporter permease [Pleurocapsa minor GSE-CHR-MK-17-07R]|jgi:peptide/nickel transport system permease protein|nr:ABC transporter permease [Pleurocapsa minor GSE-CHR-MK 17-07R]
MSTFIFRRILLTIPVILGILTLTFFLTRLIPGDPCTAIYGERATPAICANFENRYGLNLPLGQQYLAYMGRVLSGDLGDSIRFTRPVSALLAERLPVTVELAFTALIFASVVGVPLGILSAYKRNTPYDYVTMIVANIGVSMPVFWLGLMLAYIFGVGLRDTPFALPPSGRLDAGTQVIPFFVQWGLAPDEASGNPLMIFISRLYILNSILTANFDLFWNATRHLILPAAAVGTISMAIIARMTRSSVLETLNQDYVRTARAKGLREMGVVLRHAVRNALLPVVTIIGLNFGLLISGAVLTETIFGLTGVGRTLYDGITSRDYPLVQGFTVAIAIAFVIINLGVDLLYGFLDPRIRLS